jgi:hypothetical protein
LNACGDRIAEAGRVHLNRRVAFGQVNDPPERLFPIRLPAVELAHVAGALRPQTTV